MKITKRIIAAITLIIAFAFNLNAQKKKNSLLWKVEGDDIKTSYVFGTIHLIPQDDFKLKDKVKTAFDACDKAALELDMDDPQFMADMMKYAYLEKGKELKSFMDDEEYKTLDTFLKEKMGTGMAQFNNAKPFMLMSVILTANSDKPMASYEMTLLQMAKAAKKEVEGLESFKSQVDIFDETPYDEQIDDLIEMIENPDENAELYRRMVELYVSENVKELYNYMDDYMDGDAELTAKFLDDRNKKWIPKMAELSKEQSVFYAVGAGHLGGKQGVLKLLKKAGYKVTPVLD